MSSRYPVITGLGLITAAGCGVDAVWNSIARNECGLRPLSLFPSPRYGPVLTGEIAQSLDELGAPPRGSRSDRLAWIAANEAIASAGLKSATVADRAGIILGCSVGGSLGSEEFVSRLLKENHFRPGPARFHECNSAVDFVADHFGLLGPSFSVATACSSGALAIASAAEFILSGQADVMLAGGTDSLSRMTWGGFHSLLLVDAAGCRPFDANRAGMCLGEGAAVVVIESEESAQRRGAKIVARLTGWGASCDAHHATAPHPEGAGALAAMRSALRRANLDASAIGYVNAHGTGTRDNDLAEARALKSLFGERVPPFSSTKRFFGHALAASGAIEAVVCVEALRRLQLPPNPGFTELDPVIGLSPVAKLQAAPLAHVMSNSFGFGGNNAVLIFSKPEFAPQTQVADNSPVAITKLGVIPPAAAALRSIEPPLPSGEVLAHSCGALDTTSLTPNQRRRLSRIAQMALIAARKCSAQPDSQRLAVALGTGYGCLDEGSVFIENHLLKDEREPMPAKFPGSVHNAPAAQIAIDLGARGLNSAPTAGEISFECALWQALNQLRSGEVEAALAGAVDELNKYPLAIGRRWKLWSAENRPGEGAVIARLEKARANDLIARVASVRLGRLARPFDTAREVTWILESVELANVAALFSGAGGWPVLEKCYSAVMAELSARAGRQIEHRTYKTECGEFPSASALGFARAAEWVQRHQRGALLYTLSPRGGKALCLLEP